MYIQVCFIAHQNSILNDFFYGHLLTFHDLIKGGGYKELWQPMTCWKGRRRYSGEESGHQKLPAFPSESDNKNAANQRKTRGKSHQLPWLVLSFSPVTTALAHQAEKCNLQAPHTQWCLPGPQAYTHEYILKACIAHCTHIQTLVHHGRSLQIWRLTQFCLFLRHELSSSIQFWSG